MTSMTTTPSGFVEYVNQLQVLDELIEHAENAYFVKDLEGKYIVANKAAVRYLGKKSKEEVIGKTDRDIFPADLATYICNVDKGVKDTGSKHHQEHPLEIDGKTEYFLVTIDLARDKLNRTIGVTGVVVDITDYKEEQEKLVSEQQKSAILDTSNKIKSNFLSNLSHNLRTPLMGIMGAAFINIDNITVPTAVKKDFELFKYSAELLLNVVNDIIDYAPIIDSEVKLIPKSFHMSTFVYFLKEVVTEICKERGIQFNYIVSNSIPKVMVGDYQQLSHVVNKLILICLTDVSLGGFLKVEVDANKLDSAESMEMIQLVFRVSSSRQVSADVAERMFLPYTDVKERDMIEHESSIGLDIFIIRKIVAAMNGKLSFENQNSGTIFQLLIPLPVMHTGETLEKQIPKMKIIVAEDNKINQMVLQRMLDKLHSDTFFADNGQICVDEYVRNMTNAKETSYNLILMDIQMPVMNGIDATRAIRKMEKEKGWHPIKIMAITAFVTEQDRQDCFEAGMDEFISKPITPAMLSDVLLNLQMGEISSPMTDRKLPST